MTDDEREAREWLKSWASSRSAMAAKYGRTILALLDAPRMPRPEDVPPHVLEKMLRVYFMRREEATDFDDMRAAYRALYDHFTAPPKPKKVEAWAVVWPHYTAAFTDRKDAEVCAANGPQGAPCRIVKLVEAADE